MRKLLITVAVIVGIMVTAVAALPFVLTADFVAERLSAAVKERTGRDLTVRIASLSVFPQFKVVVETATLSDVPGSGRPAMLELGPTVMEMPVWPLLRRHRGGASPDHRPSSGQPSGGRPWTTQLGVWPSG